MGWEYPHVRYNKQTYTLHFRNLPNKANVTITKSTDMESRMKMNMRKGWDDKGENLIY